MKTFVSLLKVLSVAALVSSCAYENDPGLAPKPDPNAKPAVNDPYAKMAPPELLTAKYKALTADCSIESTLADASGDVAAETEAETPPTAPPPEEPPVANQGPRTVINWVAQQKVDAELKQEVPAQMVLEIPAADQSVESTVTVSLASKPVTFIPDETKKIGTAVYVLKHSPKMTASVTFTMSGKNAVELDPSDIEISEKIKLTKVLARTGDGREKRVHTLSCMLQGEVTDKPEAQGQWLMVDCAAAAPGDDKPEEKKVFAAHCPKDTPPPAQPPTK